MALKFAQSAGGGLDDGGPTSPFLLGGVPSSPSPDDKGRSGSGGGGVPGGVGPLLPTAQPPAFPLLGGKQPGGFPLSLLYGQPSSYLLVGSAPFMPLPPQGDLTRGLLFPPLHAGFDPLAKVLHAERMASCLDLAARSYAHQRPGSKGGADGRNPLLSAPTLPFPWRGPHLDMMGGSDGAGGSPPPFGQDRGGSPSKGLDLKRADHLAGPLGSPKWSLGQATSCPVCGVTLAQAQMADHFQLEMDKLADFYSCRRWVDRSHEEASLPEPQVQCRPSYDAGKRSPLSRWETYLKVRGNRHQRLNALCGRRRRAELPLDLQSADGSPPGTPHGRGPPPPPPSLKVELSDNAYDHGESRRPSDVPGDALTLTLTGSVPDGPSGTADETIRWKCVVCSEPYRTPLVSVCCWHVHCERCWLQTLGSKRLCPQCDAVTCPSDLRKIYL
ncbi:uncharacterized protein LOC121048491 [Ixodes scapularis]|uniref:uncharacterized protein LOC121048491 n=1 Tax=Ixodes scapularis TaxID=6945 RepID=UPI001AD6E655|nr:uncharacterized protein LOC121048491 [Ixodes scapularis]